MSSRLALVAAVLITANAAQAGEHLEPENGELSGGWPNDYHAAVRDTLVRGVHPGALLVVTLPSFRPEWAAWVQSEPEPRACSCTVPVPIWNGADPSHPHVPAEAPAPSCAPLSSKVARAIRAGWIAMLRATRYEEDDSLRFDGVAYHFSGFARGQGRLAGSTWSPDPNTDTGRLVELAEALLAYSLAPSEGGERALCDLASALPAASRDSSERCK